MRLSKNVKEELDGIMIFEYNLDEGYGSHPCKGSTAGSVDLAFITLTEPEVPMKRIPLSQNKYVLVDDADYEWLNQWKWYANWIGNTWYAKRHFSKIAGKQTMIQMHRLILGLKHGDGKHTDHIDGNGLNNSRSNLRVCTIQENGFNRRRNVAGSSKFKGVCWNKRDNKWMAYIRHKKRFVYLGCFTNEIDAAKAYDKKAKELFGEFARLNFTGEDCYA